MPTAKKLVVDGPRLRVLRDEQKLSLQQLADAYTRQRTLDPIRYAKARRLDGTALSRLETWVPGQTDGRGLDHSRVNEDTAQLLADALRVPLDEVARPLGGQNQESGEIGTSFAVGTSAEEPKNIYGRVGVKDLGLPADLEYVDLPFVPVQARGSFIEMCGNADDYGDTETVRYLLPPRPPEEYMKNKSRVFEINGDSMEPEVLNGERVVADPVPESRWELLHDKLVIISYDDTLTCKRVKENELLTRRVLTLYPARPDLSPLTVRRELIHCIYVVRESFERKQWR